MAVGATLTTQISQLLFRFSNGNFLFFLIFALSWIKPLNVNITVALDGEIREQFPKLYICEYEDLNASK